MREKFLKNMDGVIVVVNFCNLIVYHFNIMDLTFNPYKLHQPPPSLLLQQQQQQLPHKQQQQLSSTPPDSPIKEPNQEYLNHFKQVMKLYKEKTDEIARINEFLREQRKQASIKLNELRNQQEQYSKFIMDFMQKYNIDKVNFPDTTIRFHIKKTKPRFNKDFVQSTLTEVLKSDEKASKIMDRIENKAQTDVKQIPRLMTMKKRQQKKQEIDLM